MGVPNEKAPSDESTLKSPIRKEFLVSFLLLNMNDQPVIINILKCFKMERQKTEIIDKDEP